MMLRSWKFAPRPDRRLEPKATRLKIFDSWRCPPEIPFCGSTVSPYCFCWPNARMRDLGLTAASFCRFSFALKLPRFPESALTIRLTTPRTLLQAGVRGLLRDLNLFDILSK